MVAAEPGAGTTATEAPDGGTTFGKLKQTLSSSLLTAQDKGTLETRLNGTNIDGQIIADEGEDKGRVIKVRGKEIIHN